jgi:ArsR family transcriptional regulator
MAERNDLEPSGPVVPATLTDPEAAELERLFKALADRNRLRILSLLAGADDAVCVCKLEPALGLAQPTVSYHLKLLVEAGLLERERRGRFGFYRIPARAHERVSKLVAEPATRERAA